MMIDQLRAEHREARDRASQLRNALEGAEQHQERARVAAENWHRVQHLDCEPTFITTAGGFARDVDGSLRRPDIAMKAPPTDAEVAELRKAAEQAEKVEERARERLEAEAAKGERRETQPETGFYVTRSRKIAGIQYHPGDAIPTDVVDHRRFQQLLNTGLVARVSV